MTMKWHRSVAAIAALIALGGTAEAGEILTAGPAYGGDEQLASGSSVVCALFNTGSTPAVISLRQIINSKGGGTAVTIVSSSCTSALLPEKTCDYFAHTSSGTYTCRAVITEGNVTGTMAIYSASNHLLVSVPMTK
jgi:hypothetical protein